MQLRLPERLGRFAAIGLTATALYAVLAWSIVTMLTVPAATASFAAYAIAAVFSYLGHRRVTFKSERRHIESAPVFAGISLAGYGIAAGAPLVLTDLLGAPIGSGILVTCVAVPLVNFFAMRQLAFAPRSS